MWSGVLQLLGILLALWGVYGVRDGLRRLGVGVLGRRARLRLWRDHRRQQLRTWWWSARGRRGQQPTMSVGSDRTARWAVRAPVAQIARPRPGGEDGAVETVTLLDEQLDDVYAQLQRLEVRCAAGEDERLKWVGALKAEIATATREGWRWVFAGLVCSAAGTLLGFWA